jgi:hypothetical protein
VAHIVKTPKIGLNAGLFKPVDADGFCSRGVDRKWWLGKVMPIEELNPGLSRKCEIDCSVHATSGGDPRFS